jgi:hypothetical protein
VKNIIQHLKISVVFFKEMEINTTTVTIFAMVAAIGLIGVVVIEVVSTTQEVTAAGCRTSIAFNASQGRCFGH